MRKHLLALGFASCAWFTSAANAAITIDINQQASDVVATAIGSIDLNGLLKQGQYGNLNQVYATIADVDVGRAGFITQYVGFDGPSNFGSGAQKIANFYDGDRFALVGAFNSVYVSDAYLSGSPINGTAIFNNQTLETLGLTPGVYTYSSAFDTVTVNIGGAVPEPATWAMMLLGFGAIGWQVRRRRSRNLAFAQSA